MSEGKEYPGFAPEHDAPIPYMQRIRDYYQELGYGAPYRWAHYAEVPFRPLEKPLAEKAGGIRTAPPPSGRVNQPAPALNHRRWQSSSGTHTVCPFRPVLPCAGPR